MIRIIFILLLELGNIWYPAYAISTSCKPIPIQEESIKLLAKKPSLVMIHNISKTDLWITHPVSSASASAGWSSRLQVARWSALAMVQKIAEPFELICIESIPGHEQQVPCADVITLCNWAAKKTPPNAAKIFWAAENLKWSELREHIARGQFVLAGR